MNICPVGNEEVMTEYNLEAMLRSQERPRQKGATAARNVEIRRLYDTKRQMAVQGFLRAIGPRTKQ